MTEFIQLINDYGPLVAAVIFFVWRDYKREGEAIVRQAELEHFIQTKLLTATIESTVALRQNTEALNMIYLVVNKCATLQTQGNKA